MNKPTFIRKMNLAVYDLYDKDEIVITGTIHDLEKYTGLTKADLRSKTKQTSNPRIVNTGRKVMREIEQVNGMRIKSTRDNLANNVFGVEESNKKIKVFISNAEVLERKLYKMHRQYFNKLVQMEAYDDTKSIMVDLMSKIDEVTNAWAYASEVKEWQMIEENLMSEIIEDGDLGE